MGAPSPEVQMASVAHRMVSVLFYTCPDNYQCGGPAEAAMSAVDSILHVMGIGVPLLQKTSHEDTSEYQKAIREHAVTHDSIMGGYVQHRSQILSSALFSLMYDMRQRDFRTIPEATEKAILSLIHWFCQKRNMKPEDLLALLKEDVHDEVVQLEQSMIPKDAA